MSEAPPATAAAPAPAVAISADPRDVAGTPITSTQTPSLGPLFAELGISLAFTTYQAGKVVVLRHDEGRVATDFMDAKKPMGLAAAGSNLALGLLGEIAFYNDVKENCAKLEPAGKFDACYVPRYRHITGEIDIHEMAFDRNGTLWFINTRFSALCTLQGSTSFQPVWRPPFVTDYVADDRCHLNGLGLCEGQPRFVTAHGESDVRSGWRERKADGGILMDISSGRIVCRGLSMPHSPRWHADRLWVCESGKGSLATVDVDTGKLETVYQFDGFTRGLDFHGPFAFVGLSEVRESATFSGIPIADPGRERTCAIAVVDLRDRSAAGMLRFNTGVHEIFAVQVLPQARSAQLLDGYHPVALGTYFLPPATARRMAAGESARVAASAESKKAAPGERADAP
jgi:uncharacterized protein (TIGR03032 family)